MTEPPLLLILIAALAFYPVAKTLVTVLHMLGGGIATAFFTREKTIVYLGSYGAPPKSRQLSIWHIEIHVRYDTFPWDEGLIVPLAKRMSYRHRIISTLAGHLIHFPLAVTFCCLAYILDLNGLIKTLSLIFLYFSIRSLYGNFKISEIPLVTYSGDLAYNDGFHLRELSRARKYPRKFRDAEDLYLENQYAKSAALLEELLTEGFKDIVVYRLVLGAYLQTKEYEKARKIIDAQLVFGEMEADDFVNAGIVYAELNRYDDAFIFYDKALEMNPLHDIALNNKGYIFTVLHRYAEAVPLLDRAISINNKLAYAYDNRGLARVKLGDMAGGWEDIIHSLHLDDTNSYAYRNLGIYHLERKEFYEALQQFKIAKEIDSTTPQLEELIATTKQLAGI